MTEPLPEVHLDPHDVARYVAGSLGLADRTRLEAHLADCEACVAEVAAVSRLRPRASGPARWITVAVAAAAAIAAVMVARPNPRPPGDDNPVLRGGAAGVAIAEIAPAEGAALRSAPVFAWHPVMGAATYRITVSRPDGDSVWAAVVRDTSVAAPPSALSAGAYYWYVDALLSDGRSVTGRARGFRLGP